MKTTKFIFRRWRNLQFLRQLKFNYSGDRNRLGATLFSPKPFLLLSIFVLGLEWKLYQLKQFGSYFFKKYEWIKNWPRYIEQDSRCADNDNGTPFAVRHCNQSDSCWASWLCFITIKSIKCTYHFKLNVSLIFMNGGPDTRLTVRSRVPGGGQRVRLSRIGRSERDQSRSRQDSHLEPGNNCIWLVGARSRDLIIYQNCRSWMISLRGWLHEMNVSRRRNLLITTSHPAGFPVQHSTWAGESEISLLIKQPEPLNDRHKRKNSVSANGSLTLFSLDMVIIVDLVRQNDSTGR